MISLKCNVTLMCICQVATEYQLMRYGTHLACKYSLCFSQDEYLRTGCVRVLLISNHSQLGECNITFKRYRMWPIHIVFLTSCVLQVSVKGQVIRSEICGAVKMKVYLTGMPELRLGLNDKILFENTGSKGFCMSTCTCMRCVCVYMHTQ